MYLYLFMYVYTCVRVHACVSGVLCVAATYTFWVTRPGGTHAAA